MIDTYIIRTKKTNKKVLKKLKITWVTYNERSKFFEGCKVSEKALRILNKLPKKKISCEKEKIRFSASKMGLLLNDCFGKYYYKYVLKLPVGEVIWPGTVLGLLNHKFLEIAIKLRKKKWDNKQILELFRGKFEKIFYKIILREKNRNRIFRQSRDYSFDQRRYLRNKEKLTLKFVSFVLKYFSDFDNVECEKKITIKYEEGIELTGFIDLILFYGDRYIIVDFKTTKDSNNFYFVNWEKDLQSLIYVYLNAETRKLMPDSCNYLVFNHEEKAIFIKTYLIEDYDFSHLHGAIAKSCKLHENGTNKSFNPSKDRCKWCDYGRWCIKSKNKFKYKRMPKKLRAVLDEYGVEYE